MATETLYIHAGKAMALPRALSPGLERREKPMRKTVKKPASARDYTRRATAKARAMARRADRRTKGAAAHLFSFA